MSERGRRWRTVVRWIGLPVFAVCLWRVDLRALGARLAHLDSRFVVLFLGLSVPFYVLCAWRWQFTSARLGASLPFRRAWLDYYLSTLLNQILPVGVAGDVVRAARHRDRLGGPVASRSESWSTPAGAVVLERFSGFVALALFVVASGALWFVRERRASFAAFGGVLVGIVLLASLSASLAARSPKLAPFVSRARGALLGRGALGFHLLVSASAVALLLAMFACAGRAAGVAMSAFAVVQVVPLVLATTTLPWAFAGLGPREVATASLFALIGLGPADGVAVSITFGALSLLASAPGAIVLLLPRRHRA